MAGWEKDYRNPEAHGSQSCLEAISAGLRLRVTCRKRAGTHVLDGRNTPLFREETLAGDTGAVSLLQTVTNTFRTANVLIQSQDQRLLTLWLDKDSRRTFRDVLR